MLSIFENFFETMPGENGETNYYLFKPNSISVPDLKDEHGQTFGNHLMQNKGATPEEIESMRQGMSLASDPYGRNVHFKVHNPAWSQDFNNLATKGVNVAIGANNPQTQQELLNGMERSRSLIDTGKVYANRGVNWIAHNPVATGVGVGAAAAAGLAGYYAGKRRQQ